MYSYVITNETIVVMQASTGAFYRFSKEDPNFSKVRELIRQNKMDEIPKLSVRGSVEEMLKENTLPDSRKNFDIYIKNNDIFFYFNGSEVKVHNVLVDVIINMAREGFNIEPMKKFLSNLLRNPSSSAVEELYDFIQQAELPITEDGCFIAYKIVKDDYMDIYTGTIDNSVGAVVSMPRFKVDDNRKSTCSSGLHFCSKGYLDKYGSNQRDSDRVVLVKINPKDVVSIPIDYQNAKGRCCSYTVISDITTKGWREKLTTKNFVSVPVIDTKIFEPALDGDGVEDDKVWHMAKFSPSLQRWVDSISGKIIAKSRIENHPDGRVTTTLEGYYCD